MWGKKTIPTLLACSGLLAFSGCKNEYASTPMAPQIPSTPSTPTDPQMTPGDTDAAAPAPPDGGAGPIGVTDAGASSDAGPFLGRVAGGTRLKANFASRVDTNKFFLITDDGFGSFHDSQLNLDCTFHPAADGKSRCLPAPAPEALHYFKDAACGEPLLPAEASCARRQGVRTVAGKMSVFELGAAVMQTTAAYSLQPDASGALKCVADSTAVGQQFFALARELPSDMFVARESAIEPVPNRRVLALVHTATDGTKERTSWYDANRKAYCSIEVASDGQARCETRTDTYAFPANRFADAACTQNVLAVAPSATPPAAYYVKTLDTAACPARYTIRATETTNITATYFKNETGACVAAPALAAGVTYHLVKAAIAPTEFPAFRETIEGKGRLRQLVRTSTDGAVDPVSRPIDTMFFDTCAFGRTSDGRLRCLPLADPIDNYADAACSKPASPSSRQSCDATAMQTAVVTGPWCAPVRKAYKLGAAVSQVYRKNASGTCEAVKRSGIYELGEEVPDATFAEAELIFE